MHAEDHAAGGAEALEGGDHLAPAIDVGGNRIGDTDTADQQGGQADQRQELAQSLQRARNLRRGIAAVADGEATFGQRLLGALGEIHETAVVLAGTAVELQRIAPLTRLPGSIRPVLRSVSSETNTRGPTVRRSVSLSGSASMVARIGTWSLPSES